MYTTFMECFRLALLLVSGGYLTVGVQDVCFGFSHLVWHTLKILVTRESRHHLPMYKLRKSISTNVLKSIMIVCKAQ